MIIIPISDLISYTFHICKPDLELTGVNGYLRRHNMVNIKALDPSKPTQFSITIYTDSLI